MEMDFWKGKKVLITGHTGFKGSWLSLWLLHMGAEVAGYGLECCTKKDNFMVTHLTKKMQDIRGNLLEREKLEKLFHDFKPDIVFHLAAQPLVRKSYQFPAETYETNVMGTLYVLECVRKESSVKEAIIITTDKCYANKEQIWGYRENDAFGGYDPYSSSKACVEILIDSYRNSYFNLKAYPKHKKSVASVRAGNVIGGGDWCDDRIIPDCIRSIESNKNIVIRNPNSIRPWQHVLDALGGYLLLAEKMWFEPVSYAEGWNFGPEYASMVNVSKLVELLIKYMEKGKMTIDVNQNLLHEADFLFLDITKAKLRLNWFPVWNLETAVAKTVQWYKYCYENNDMYQFDIQQIEEYMEALDKMYH